MEWTISFLYAVLITSVIGGIFTIIWYLIGRLLERIGFLNILYQMLKVVLLFWYIPVSYLLVYVANEESSRWGGILFAKTPALLKAATIVSVIWFILSLLLLTRYMLSVFWSYLRYRNAMQCNCEIQEYFQDICRRMDIRAGKVALVQSHRVKVPGLVGVWRPRVILPQEEYTREQLEVILVHELTHYRQKDVLLKNLTAIATAIYFFNPFVWWLQKLVERWSEYACDDAACKNAGGFKHYFSVIMGLMEESDEEKRRDTFSSQLMERKDDLVHRVQQMERNYRMRRGSKITAGLIVLGMFLVSTISASAATIGSADAYEKLFCYTVVEVEEEPEPFPEMEEYTETELDSDITVEIGEVGNMIKSSKAGSFNWTVNAKTLKMTPGFTVSAGGSIVVTVYAKPTDKEIRVGIVEPSGTYRFVYGSGMINHVFTAKSSGTYRVYVENTNSSAVTVQGTYNAN